MDATITDIELHIAREAYGAAILASIDGTGSDAAVDAALAVLEAKELAAERAAFVVEPSRYLVNGR